MLAVNPAFLIAVSAFSKSKFSCSKCIVAFSSGKFTLAELIPSTLDNTFSTDVEHAAHVIPPIWRTTFSCACMVIATRFQY